MSDLQSLMRQYVATLDAEVEYWDGVKTSPRRMAEKYISGFLAWLELRDASEARRSTGCKKELAAGQWFASCGDTDMGQSLPALCTECGGEYKLVEHAGCGRKIHTPDPYSDGKCGFQYRPNEARQL